MPREVPLPPEWRVLEGKVHYVQRQSAKEYSSTCPRCGGTVHEDGEWPDRCRLFVDEHPTLFCRKCGLVAFPDQFGDSENIPPVSEEYLRRINERRQREERLRERKWRWLQNGYVVEKLFANLENNPRAIAYWEKRGIPREFQRFWKLGWQTDYPYNGGKIECAAIPIWGYGWEINNVKLRLIGVERSGKYRYLISGMQVRSFITDPTSKMMDVVVAVEGEIKAAVLFTRLGEFASRISVVGLPGIEPPDSALAAIQDVETLILIVDPDAEEKGEKLLSRITAKSKRLLVPPLKVDDMILADDMGTMDIIRLLKQARRVKA